MRACVYVSVDCGEVVCLTIVVDRTLLVNTGDATSDTVSTAHYAVGLCFTAFEVRVGGHNPVVTPCLSHGNGVSVFDVFKSIIIMDGFTNHFPAKMHFCVYILIFFWG